MSRRRRKSKKGKPWLWVLGAMVGAIAAYFVVLRVRADSSLPIPGQVPDRSAQAVAPREEIHKAERETLDRVLRERAHGH